jgi:hypothetical protein
MRKATFSLLLLFLILLSTSAFAERTMIDDFETGSLNISIWNGNTNDPAVSNAQAYEGTWSLQLDGGGGSIDVARTNQLGIPTTGMWIVSMWGYYGESSISDDFQPSLEDGGTTCFILNAGHDVANSWGYYTGSWNGGILSSTSGRGDVAQDWVWIRFLIDHDNNDVSVIIGNSTTVDISNASFAGGCTKIDQLELSPTSSPDYAYFDNVEVWNFTKLGWHGNATGGGAPPASDTVNITDTKPDNNTQFNSQLLDLNVTVDAADTFNCSLFLNGVLNATQAGLAAGSSVLSQFNVSFPADLEKMFNYYAECSDGTTWENSTSKMFYIDNVFPSITWTYPATDNGTVHNLVDNDNFTSLITLADDNLYSFEYNITDSGTVIYSFSDNNLTGETEYNITENFDLTSYAGDTLGATVRLCDGHTAKDLKKLQLRRTLNKELEFNNGIYIAMADPAKTRSVNAYKLKDRYSFYFESDSFRTVEEFEVMADRYIDVLHGKTEYIGHLVLDGEYWVDFETVGLKDVKITKLADNIVKVRLTSNKPRKYWSFNSIGELNCRTKSKTFKVIDPFFFEGFTDYVNSSSTLWARNLSYSLSYNCYGSNNVDMYIDNAFYQTLTPTCDETNRTLSGYYQHGTETDYLIKFVLNGTYNYTLNDWHNTSFETDLYNPTVTYFNISWVDGFNFTTANLTMGCLDTAFDNLSYNLTLNNNDVMFGYFDNNTNQTNSSVLTNGENSGFAGCGDLFGVGNDTLTFNVYMRSMFLIDERSNTAFNVQNLSSVIVYFDDNSSEFDFKAANVSGVNFTSAVTNKLRFELVYIDGSIKTRWVDISLDNTSDLRVCANPEGVKHYEQLIVSATNRPVTLKNVYSDCVVAEDYTRFAYQDSYMVKAFTISSLYYLYTYDNDDNRVYLASLDGSISTYYNLDVLDFNQEGYNVNLMGEALTFSRSGNIFTIRYRDVNNDSVSTTMTITEMNTSTDVFTTTDTTQPNEMLVYFDISTLNVSVSNFTLFKLQVETTDSEGVVEVFNRYFNMQGSSGYLVGAVAFVIALCLTIFGLTLTTAKISLGWFGIIIQLASIAILSLATATWYITLLMAFNAIILVFIIILLMNQNYSSVAGVN